jgi:hypothetical protein
MIYVIYLMYLYCIFINERVLEVRAGIEHQRCLHSCMATRSMNKSVVWKN